MKSLEEVNFEGEPAERALLPLHEPLPHALVVVDVLRKARQLHNVLVPQALQQANGTLGLGQICIGERRQHVELGGCQLGELEVLSQEQEEVDQQEQHRFDDGGLGFPEVGQNCQQYTQSGEAAFFNKYLLMRR